ncbi:MAG: hypothetical protein ACE5GN_04895 [Waddliaceae bacterium]
MSLSHNIANGIRNGVLPKEEVQKREQMSQTCAMAKVAAVAAAIFTVALTALAVFSGAPFLIAFGIIVGGFSLVALHDVYRIADNAQQMAENAATEITARINQATLQRQLSRGTIFAKPIINACAAG